MDFLLIVMAIGGLVVAIVMLVLASRVNRLQKESDERVETLEAMATGSVLFARTALGDPLYETPMTSEPDLMAEHASLPLFAQPESQPRHAALPGRVTILERPTAPLAPVAPPSPATDLDLAMNEFADEDDLTSDDAAVSEEPQSATPAPFAVTASAYPFVMTVPAAAGMGRVQISFDRSRSRSRQ